MAFARIFVLAAATGLVAVSIAACGGGVVSVGASDTKLQKLPDGGATGDGNTCSFGNGVSYGVGQSFPAPDGCNQCTCNVDGIACTLRACAPADAGRACSTEAKQCPDGSYVGRTGPSCEFAPCPSGADAGTICPGLGCDPFCPGPVKKDANGCDTCQCDYTSCPAPQPIPPDTSCTQNVVYAKNPSDGTCCMYGTPCAAPSGWTAYGDEASCKAAP